MKSFYTGFNQEEYTCETNGVISDSIVQNWTQQALECYELNCDCNSCPIKLGNYSFKCQMKSIVDILLKTKGLPNKTDILQAQIHRSDVA